MHLLYNRNFSKSKFVLGKFYCTLIKFSLITKRKPQVLNVVIEKKNGLTLVFVI